MMLTEENPLIADVKSQLAQQAELIRILQEQVNGLSEGIEALSSHQQKTADQSGPKLDWS
ncbi:hypothetical protein [Cohaesibacter celericrescens]|uniref:Uncharacterized protein n=1 Tax=Cohaesibacter celericrescens TaxID=2067669 RepID=A0A2N5XLN4_9HYPH|nr:hypothetical protein [Cohaesibacter celericrescens]PLW75403.1 hypothetical protein C0081_20265 [Cohaesibacter celericrescens]